MYKGELKERFTEHEQIVYVQAWEKALSHMETQIMLKTSDLKLTDKQRYDLQSLIQECSQSCLEWLNFGLDQEGEEK